MNYPLLLTTLISSIKAVETLMPSSQGKDKFDAAIVLVEAALGSVQSILPSLQPIATLLVNAFRASGAFAPK